MAAPAAVGTSQTSGDLKVGGADIFLDDALPNHVTLFDLAVDPPALWDEQRARLWAITAAD
ncbi:hypothetical protein ACSBPU_13250 [Parapusillimonas sp. JC17]|uniref:hypothetical protein n=1 Tax=Parapusillimonas sp. JC17 TaxID=3445768 RepID=UPI003FA09985